MSIDTAFIRSQLFWADGRPSEAAGEAIGALCDEVDSLRLELAEAREEIAGWERMHSEAIDYGDALSRELAAARVEHSAVVAEYMQEESWKQRLARDFAVKMQELEARIAAQEPVITAALAWRDARPGPWYGGTDSDFHLLTTVDAYRQEQRAAPAETTFQTADGQRVGQHDFVPCRFKAACDGAHCYDCHDQRDHPVHRRHLRGDPDVDAYRQVQRETDPTCPCTDTRECEVCTPDGQHEAGEFVGPCREHADDGTGFCAACCNKVAASWTADGKRVQGEPETAAGCACELGSCRMTHGPGEGCAWVPYADEDCGCPPEVQCGHPFAGVPTETPEPATQRHEFAPNRIDGYCDHAYVDDEGIETGDCGEPASHPVHEGEAT